MTGLAHTVTPELAKAYRTALYVIQGDEGEIPLRVGQTCPELAALIRQYGGSSAAFLTAFNPRSILATATVNAANHSALIQDIQYLGLKSIAGEGSDSAGLWHSEPSVLVLGIALKDAGLLADRYQQNAFLWIGGIDGSIDLHFRYPVDGLNET